MTNSNDQNNDQEQTKDQSAAQEENYPIGGGYDLWLTDEDEEILDRIWRSPEMIEATIKARDKESGTAGKTLDWRTGRALTQEEMDFFNHGPYSKGEKDRSATDWQRVYDYEKEHGIESTIPEEYRHFVRAFGMVTPAPTNKTIRRTKSS